MISCFSAGGAVSFMMGVSIEVRKVVSRSEGNVGVYTWRKNHLREQKELIKRLLLRFLRYEW